MVFSQEYQYLAVVGTGVALVIGGLTGIFAMGEDENSSSIDCDDELELEEESDDDGTLIVRAS